MTRPEEQPDDSATNTSRRKFLAGTSLALFAGVVGTTPARAVAAGGRPATSSPADIIAAATHPGMQHTAASLNAAASRVSAGTQPTVAGWNRLLANGRSASTWAARPLADVIRGGTGQNYAQMFPDIHAAYQNALRWRIAGTEANGAAAVRILNAWSATQRTLGGNADRFLAAGIYGYQWANAAELVRDRSDFDRVRFRDMLLSIYHPMNEQFLTNHNDAVITNYWANWDLCNMASILAIGIFADRNDLIDRAVDYFETGAGNGSITHAVPYLYSDDGGLGQWQESGRDQGHSVMGIGLMAAFCEMAWNQGFDCYGYDNNRFLKGAQYVAKYNLGNSVPFTEYSWQSGPRTSPSWNTQTVVSSASRGQARPIWEMVLAHYSGRRGLSARWVEQIALSVRPEGGGGDYGSNSGGYDQLGFGTLTYAGAGGSGSAYVTIRNASTGLYLDGMGRTADGANAGQYAGGSSGNQQWITEASGAYVAIRNRATGLYLDGMGRTANGSALGQYAGSGSSNQQWSLVTVGADVRIRNRATGLYLDGMGRTANGADVAQYSDSTATTQRWRTIAGG
jgi:hypothetical protein